MRSSVETVFQSNKPHYGLGPDSPETKGGFVSVNRCLRGAPSLASIGRSRR